VSDHPVHQDDVTALRAEGDLKAYMQQLRAAGRNRLNPAPAARKTRRWAAIPMPPDHKPGQWPPGTQPPGPPPEWDLPPEAWADAVRRYRDEEREANEENDA
jgi:hypothetical protein